LSMILLTEGYESLDTIIVFLVSNVRDFFSRVKENLSGSAPRVNFPRAQMEGRLLSYSQERERPTKPRTVP